MRAKRVRAKTSEGYIRTTVALPEALHRRLMREALESNVVATEIMRRALTAWLGRERRAR